jgi:hypothetical protein
MACPDGRFGADLFIAAMNNFELWEAMFCPFAGPLGQLIVGTIVYSGFGLNIFIRTGSMIIPFVLILLLGATVLAQMMAIISTFAGLIVLFAAPLVVTALVFTLDIRT